MHPMQEKFQITVPSTNEAGEGWADLSSVRDTAGTDLACYNDMPPGMEIDKQHSIKQDAMPLNLAGSSDVSGRMASESTFNTGFTKLSMRAVDDQDTSTHVDQFYGDAGGFVERNNYLDRE